MSYVDGTITFFQRFEHNILAGLKTVTLRNAEQAAAWSARQILSVLTHETQKWFCNIFVDSVTPILLTDLDDTHAVQENISLEELNAVIKDIYGENIKELWVVKFHLVQVWENL